METEKPKATAKAMLGLAQLVVVIALALFLPAGTAAFINGWIFLFLFSTSSLAITLYLAKKDPALLARRAQAGPAAEKERGQKIVQSVASLAFLALLVVPALDYRFRWSQASLAPVVLGGVLVVLGFVAVFFVFRENTFTSSVIEVAPEQRVVETGPYAVVRHPMYAGALVLLLGVPLALGSYIGLAVVVPFVAILVWRLRDEERFLASHLTGYAEYQKKTRYRLIPRIW